VKTVSQWKLTEREALTCDMLLKHGSNQAIAMELRVSDLTVYHRLLGARRKVGVANAVLLALKWAEFRRIQATEATAGVASCTACQGMGFTVKGRP
jgi:DNA-binding CsgD family transcriptional regulator